MLLGIVRKGARFQSVDDAVTAPSSAEMIDDQIVGNPKQPGAHRREFLQLRELVVRAGESVLDNIFSVGD